MNKLTLTLALAAIATIAPTAANAVEGELRGGIPIPWPEGVMFEYKAGDGKHLLDVIDELNEKLEEATPDSQEPLFFSPSSAIENQDPQVGLTDRTCSFAEFFDALVENLDLAYWYHTENKKMVAGNEIPNPQVTLYLRAATGVMDSRWLDVGELSVRELEANLGAAYPVTLEKDDQNGRLLVKGPVAYGSYVKGQIAKSAQGTSDNPPAQKGATGSEPQSETPKDSKPEPEPAEEEIKVWVFSLKHAWARDIELPIWLEDEQSMMIPGVASILRDVFPEELEENSGENLFGTSFTAGLGFAALAGTPDDRRTGRSRSTAVAAGAGDDVLLRLNEQLIGSDQRVGGLRGTGLASGRIRAQRFANLQRPANVIVVNQDSAGSGRGFSPDGQTNMIHKADGKTTAIEGDGKWRRSIFADPRNNSIIVADKASRREMYEKLIKQLDQPRDLIEISVAIIDINVGTGLTWGVDYLSAGMTEINKAKTLYGGSFDSTEALNGLLENGSDLESTVTGRGLAASALLIGDNASLFARVRALEEENIAQVLSRPSVLALDNGNAVIDDETTFHVRVAGNEEVDLFPIPVKTRLRVNPHIFTNSRGDKRIRLDVYIKDGAIVGNQPDPDDDETRSNIPVVSESKVSTEAVLRPNQSLMVGGRYRDEQTDAEGRIPLVGRIPVIGLAFKDKIVQTRTLQRMFIITPKILGTVPPPGSTGVRPMSQK